MPKVNRITPEQYLELASLGLPIWADSWLGGGGEEDSYRNISLYHLMDTKSQEIERGNARRYVEEGTYKDYFTLVDDEESNGDGS